MPAAEALADAGIKPIKLAPKEGLALLNGTQVSTALALAAAFRTENLFNGRGDDGGCDVVRRN